MAHSDHVGFGAFLCTLNSMHHEHHLPTIEQDHQIQRAQSSWLVLIFLLVLTATRCDRQAVGPHRAPHIISSGISVFHLRRLSGGFSKGFCRFSWAGPAGSGGS
jgi:hypothetical protein